MWTVEVDCPSVGDVEGYNWSFPADARGGSGKRNEQRACALTFNRA
jgi:hypothetical protein